VVARLKAAGAILVGKSNTPEFTYAFETDNPVYGRTNNPYDLERSPAGSSGGAAAIVAAAAVPFDIGTDTGGSIRVPAHMCGIAGIKPTTGRVPRTGHAVPPGSLVDPLTQVGPMARYVEDLGLILPIIAGPDGRDPFVPPVQLRDWRLAIGRLRGLRAAFYTDNGIRTPSADIIKAVEAAADALALAGVRIIETRPPGIEETRDLLSLLYRGWDGAAMVKMLLAGAGTDPAQSSLKRYLEGDLQPGDKVAELIDRWDRFRLRLHAWMNDYDLIVAPAAAFTALAHGEFLTNYPGFSYTMTYNLTGWPGAVVRCGTSAAGLPIGVQLVARPWREGVALAAAYYLETVFGGWQRPALLSEQLAVGARQPGNA
jgi:amidase